MRIQAVCIVLRWRQGPYGGFDGGSWAPQMGAATRARQYKRGGFDCHSLAPQIGKGTQSPAMTG